MCLASPGACVYLRSLENWDYLLCLPESVCQPQRLAQTLWLPEASGQAQLTSPGSHCLWTRPHSTQRPVIPWVRPPQTISECQPKCSPEGGTAQGRETALWFIISKKWCNVIHNLNLLCKWHMILILLIIWGWYLHWKYGLLLHCSRLKTKITWISFQNKFLLHLLSSKSNKIYFFGLKVMSLEVRTATSWNIGSILHWSPYNVTASLWFFSLHCKPENYNRKNI